MPKFTFFGHFRMAVFFCFKMYDLSSSALLAWLIESKSLHIPTLFSILSTWSKLKCSNLYFNSLFPNLSLKMVLCISFSWGSGVRSVLYSSVVSLNKLSTSLHFYFGKLTIGVLLVSVFLPQECFCCWCSSDFAP